jgi:uncharacterized membrane protein
VNVPMVALHIAGGSSALLAGAAALSLRKGGRPHAKAGTIFFAAMLLMAGSGALMAGLNGERGTMTVGIMTLYLVATSWVTARRRDGGTGRFEIAAMILISACAAAQLGFGLIGVNAANGRFDSLPGAVHFPFAVLAALAACLDLNYILRRETAQRQRIARHLWRMCAALLIAAFSFFLGQQKVMPVAWRGSPLFFLPELAVLAAMIFWLVRVRFAKAWMRAGKRLAPAGHAPGLAVHLI